MVHTFRVATVLIILLGFWQDLEEGTTCLRKGGWFMAVIDWFRIAGYYGMHCFGLETNPYREVSTNKHRSNSITFYIGNVRGIYTTYQGQLAVALIKYL